MSVKKDDMKSKSGSIIARSDDGTIQITFTIPFARIKETREKEALELAKTIDVAGFRKGKAPLEKIIERVPENTLLEKTLSKILPELLNTAINEHKIKPAVYPKFKLIKAQENEDWQIRAITCEINDIKLGDYKQSLATLSRGKKNQIWTPDKVKKETGAEDEKSQTREEKEQEIIKSILKKTDLMVPQMLIDDEVNSRLSKLLERLEKLGLTLESYLTSINKTADTLRKEYQEQAKNSISLDLILNQVASEENITVDEKEIDSAISAAQADHKLALELSTPDKKRFLEVILRRRKALDFLISLA